MIHMGLGEKIDSHVIIYHIMSFFFITATKEPKQMNMEDSSVVTKVTKSVEDYQSIATEMVHRCVYKSKDYM